MVAEIRAVAADHPDIVRLDSIGTTWHGRTIHLVEISDRPGVDEGEPEVLFDALHHAREHLTPEMALSIIHLLSDGHASGDARITRLVESRRIWIVPMLNPDGLRYDLAGDPYRGWRKNRQPNGDGEAIGTDLNRNYAHGWGGIGSSGDPASLLYRGAAPFSAPEAAAMRDFILSRQADGRQRIRTHISFHTAGEYILWPYGYTSRDVPPDMTGLDHRVFTTFAGRLAGTNGYDARQSGDWYVHGGTMIDWTYGRQRIFSLTFELHPSAAEDDTLDRFYPADELIAAETSINHEAVLRVLHAAACPYRVIDRSDLCGPFFDDLEIGPRGWVRDAAGTDTATAGRWERGRPEATSSEGPKQLARVASGRHAFVTGLRSLGCASCNDLDGGITSLRSPAIALPAGTAPVLSLRASLAHSAASGPEDGLSVSVLHAGRRTAVATLPGAPHDRDAAWGRLTADLRAWSGETIRIELRAADTGTPSLVEVAVDQIVVSIP
jgi:hypothetical protein